MRILLVEDERKSASFIARTLRENAYVVDIADTGEKALELSSNLTYDAILLDVRLPGISGIEVCRELRQRGVEAPVMMLTARTLVEQRVEGLDAGADDYLSKPLFWPSFSRASEHLCAAASTKGMLAFATRTWSWIATTGVPLAIKKSFR
jgi:DNA-binding response OmpR family regulator